MIAIFGAVPSTDTHLIDELKKYFEADAVLLDWDGEEKEDYNKKTLAITHKKPPYKTPCCAISMQGAMRLLTTQ